MINQLKVELFKLKKCIFLYLAIIIMAATGFFYGYFKVAPLNINGLDIYMETIPDTSLMFAVGVFVLYFLSSDFGNRTIQNEIKLGYSRFSAMLIRGMVVLPVACVLHLMYPLFTAVSVSLQNGWGNEFTISQIISKTLIILLQVMTINSFLLLIVFMCKKTTSSFAAGIFFILISCNILRNFEYPELIQRIFDISCFNLLANMRISNMISVIISAIITLITVYAIGFVLFKKAEIK